MDRYGSEKQRERIYSTAAAWADEAARMVSEANPIVCDQYFGLVAMIEEDASPEELAALADIWSASAKAIDECVAAVAEGRREMAAIEAKGVAVSCLDEAWLAHRAANVARILVKTRSLCAKMGEASEEYNRICASVKMRRHPAPPDDWQPPRDPSASQDAME